MNPTFQYYGSSIKEVVPLGNLSMLRMIEAIKHPKPHIKEILTQIRYAAGNKDEDTKAYLKQKLYFFTPAVNCTYRNYESIISFTGLAPLDFDKLESEQYAIEFRDFIFNQYPEIIACWLSSSRLGVRALLRIPVVSSPDEYKLYYKGFEQEGKKYKGFDKAPQNCVLPLFISDDENLLYRPDAIEWNKQYIAPPQPPKVTAIIVYQNKQVEKVAKLVNSAMSKIVDYGHPPLRAISYALGGYVANGYLDNNEAEDIIISEIYANSYLNQKSKVNGYIKTAKDMINKGKQKPLTL